MTPANGATPWVFLGPSARLRPLHSEGSLLPSTAIPVCPTGLSAVEQSAAKRIDF